MHFRAAQIYEQFTVAFAYSARRWKFILQQLSRRKQRLKGKKLNSSTWREKKKNLVTESMEKLNRWAINWRNVTGKMYAKRNFASSTRFGGITPNLNWPSTSESPKSINLLPLRFPLLEHRVKRNHERITTSNPASVLVPSPFCASVGRMKNKCNKKNKKRRHQVTRLSEKFGEEMKQTRAGERKAVRTR